MNELLEKLQNNLSILRRQYRELRNAHNPEARNLKQQIAELENQFEKILLADIKKITSNQELFSSMEKLISKTEEAVETISNYRNNIAGIAEVMGGIRNIITAAREVIKIM